MEPGARDVDDGSAAVPPTIRVPTRAVRRKAPFRLRSTTLSHMASVTSVSVAVEEGHAGVVDQHVDPAEGVVGGVDQAVELVPVAHVGSDTARARRPRGLDLRGHRLAGVELAAGDDDVGPGVGEGRGPWPAPAPGCPR